MEAINLIIRSIFVDNMIFASCRGMCSFLAVSQNVKTALGLGVAVTFVLVITLPLNYLLENYVLKAGALAWLGDEYATMDLSVFSLLIFIAIIASLTQLVEMVIERFSPALYSALGIFLPSSRKLCHLRRSLFMQQREFANVGLATAYGFGSGIGWLLAIVRMAAIREKLEYSNVPKPLKGLGITFIITALMAIGFMSFAGIDI